MIIKKALPAGMLLLLFTGSCKQMPDERIIRNWQEVTIENEQTRQMQVQQAILDTLGQHTAPEDYFRQFGTTNLDSYKLANQAKIDAFRMQQQQISDSTRFDFRKNGIMYLKSGNGLDSASWYFEGDSVLVLDKNKLKGNGHQLRLGILSLSDTLLKVKFELNQISNIATFVPYKK